MTSKTRIINKLKKTERAPLPLPNVSRDKDIFADYPSQKPAALLEQFRTNLVNLAGEFHLAASADEAANIVLNLLNGIEGGKYCADFSALCQKIFAANPALKKRFDVPSDHPVSSPDFANFAAGLTSADFLVARTGSVILRSEIAGGRRLSVLPPLHIVVAGRSQLVPSLENALPSPQFQRGDWRYGTIITGPSRTSDIEKILVLGAHGPKRLVVIVIE